MLSPNGLRRAMIPLGKMPSECSLPAHSSEARIRVRTFYKTSESERGCRCSKINIYSWNLLSFWGWARGDIRCDRKLSVLITSWGGHVWFMSSMWKILIFNRFAAWRTHAHPNVPRVVVLLSSAGPPSRARTPSSPVSKFQGKEVPTFLLGALLCKKVFGPIRKHLNQHNRPIFLDSSGKI